MGIDNLITLLLTIKEQYCPEDNLGVFFVRAHTVGPPDREGNLRTVPIQHIVSHLIVEEGAPVIILAEEDLSRIFDYVEGIMYHEADNGSLRSRLIGGENASR